jgi:hypothetical protein
MAVQEAAVVAMEVAKAKEVGSTEEESVAAEEEEREAGLGADLAGMAGGMGVEADSA